MVNTGFGSLDALTQGLESGRNYLIHGHVGTGKSTFGLGFLYAGLKQGESVALLTRRPPHMVFSHAQAFGWALEPFLNEDRLLIFEYSDKVVENAQRVTDEEQILAEFKPLLLSSGVSRLLIDPITPLLASPSPMAAAFRSRSLTRSLSEAGRTNLYVVDLPEGETYINSCKEFFDGVLHFEGSQSGTRGMSIERLPSVNARRTESRLRFDLAFGHGLVAAGTTTGRNGNSDEHLHESVLAGELER